MAPDGRVWLLGAGRWGGLEVEALLRFDGSEWELVPGPEGFLNRPLGHSMAFGDDGTLWVDANHGEDDPHPLGWGVEPDWRVGGLARFDDPGWTTFTEADGVQDWGARVSSRRTCCTSPPTAASG